MNTEKEHPDVGIVLEAKSNKTLLYIGSEELASHHAGYTDDEILVPFILIKTKK